MIIYAVLSSNTDSQKIAVIILLQKLSWIGKIGDVVCTECAVMLWIKESIKNHWNYRIEINKTKELVPILESVSV